MNSKPKGQVFDREWRRRCSVVPVQRAEVADMIRAHYLAKWPGVCVLTLALMEESIAVGVIVFALPPNQTAKRYGGVTWELARLWVNDDVPTNAESYLIGKAVRYIKRKHRQVRFLVSYADPSAGHKGTIYRASNWALDGMTDQGRKTPRCDYVDANTGKKYSRKGHVPEGADIIRVPRVSKFRYCLELKNAKS
jgi:hypothetical protein